MKGKDTSTNAVRLALLAIIAHFVVVFFHAAAHQILGVQASALQTLFIVTVIIIAPPLAGLLLWKGARKTGAVLLACSMAGALVFGVYNHFVASSPDHVSEVSHMSPASWAVIFGVSALLLPVTEVIGIFAGLLVMKRGSAR